MAGDPVLNGQNRGGGRTVLKKKGIMAHTQAQQDIELRLFPVEQLGLKYGVAHGFLCPLIDFLLVPEFLFFPWGFYPLYKPLK